MSTLVKSTDLLSEVIDKKPQFLSLWTLIVLQFRYSETLNYKNYKVKLHVEL